MGMQVTEPRGSVGHNRSAVTLGYACHAEGRGFESHHPLFVKAPVWGPFVAAFSLGSSIPAKSPGEIVARVKELLKVRQH
jgi:hypothetical protein